MLRRRHLRVPVLETYAGCCSQTMVRSAESDGVVQATSRPLPDCRPLTFVQSPELLDVPGGRIEDRLEIGRYQIIVILYHMLR